MTSPMPSMSEMPNNRLYCEQEGGCLLHYSSKPLGRVESKSQSSHADMKPKGLWVSVGDAWREWCENEDFRLEDLAEVSTVSLRDDHRVLWLKSVDELLRLGEWFGEPLAGTSMHCIKWHEIAEQWDGIVISPYQWSARLNDDTAWYYGWDCASGCIWNAAAISNLEEL